MVRADVSDSAAEHVRQPGDRADHDERRCASRIVAGAWLFEADYLLWWVRKGDTPMGGVIGVAPVSDFANSTDGTLPNLTSVDS